MYKKLPYPLVRRLLAFLIAPPYLVGVAAILSAATAMTFGLAVICAASVVMAVLGVLGVKAQQEKAPVRRFRLSSVFLLTVPLAIYLAAIRSVFTGMDMRGLTVPNWIVVAVCCVDFMIVTTLVLQCFTEAIVWTVVMKRRVTSRSLRPPPDLPLAR